MLAQKIEGRLAKTIVEPSKALAKAGVRGHILSMVASWHRTLEDGKEKVDMASFNFLMSKGGKPLQVEVFYERGEFRVNVADLERELGRVDEEEEFRGKLRVISDAEVVKTIEGDERVKEAMKKAKHLRLFSLSFLLYDEEFEMPVWRALLKNWPLTNYFRREKPLTLEVVVNAVNGRIEKVQKVI